MKAKWKKIKKGRLFFIFLIFFSTLALASHLQHALGSDSSSNPPIQLSRIDFKEPVDSLSANQIKSTVLHLNGVQHTYFNVTDGIVVFSHDPKTLPAQTVLEKVRSVHGFKAERYLPDPEMVGSGCPVTGKNSIFIRIGRYIRNIF